MKDRSYPRLIAEFPGVLILVRTKEEHDARKRANLRAALIIFWAAAAGILIPLFLFLFGG